uniref:Family with sequence similarity 53 member C n=1 Tax=Sphenodon punctatus TaxID=8508 RepID=A0A8D0GCW9_SPHPU
MKIMITLITEQLQKQSLEELKCTSFSISLPLPDHADVAGCGSPFQFAPEETSWKDLAPCPKIHLQDDTGPYYHHSSLSLPLPPCSPDSCPQNSIVSQTLAADPLASERASVPPTKRHCRSLSVPEDLSRWQAIWRPLGSKVWTPIKHRDSSRRDTLAEQPHNLAQGATRLRFDPAPSASCQRVQGGASSSPPFFSLALSLESPANIAWEESRETLQPCPLQRRFSLSPVRFLPSQRSSATSTPELLRHQHGLLRSHSQPCDLDTRKSGLKRRHDEDVRWHRPSLDFYKMNQKQFSGGICLLDKSEEGDSPSWFLTCSPQAPSAPCSPISGCIQVLSESEEEEEAAEAAARRLNWNLDDKRTLFQQDFSDLDLTLIEEN